MYVFDRYISLQFLLILVQYNEGTDDARYPSAEGEEENDSEWAAALIHHCEGWKYDS